MKKWAYVLGGFFIGAVVVTATQDVSAQIKSLIGQKVTGEYTVIVNGTKLQEKGAVIDSKANVPVRALSDSLGAELKVDNNTKTITVTSENNDDTNVSSDSSGSSAAESVVTPQESKEELLKRKSELESELSLLQKSKAEDQAKYDDMKEKGRIEGEAAWLNALEILERKIKTTTEELTKVNELLKAFE